MNTLGSVYFAIRRAEIRWVVNVSARHFASDPGSSGKNAVCKGHKLDRYKWLYQGGQFAAKNTCA